MINHHTLLNLVVTLCTGSSNIKSCKFHKKIVYVFHTILRMNSNYFLIQIFLMEAHFVLYEVQFESLYIM